MGQINVKIKKCNLMLRLRRWWFKKRRYILWNIPSATSPHRFRNVHQIHSPTLDTGKATALWKKFQKMKHNFSKISELFCHLFILVWWFWHGFSQFWLRHLKEQANVKETLHENLEHWHHVGVNSSVIDIWESGWKISFFTCYSCSNDFVLWKNQNEYPS